MYLINRGNYLFIVERPLKDMCTMYCANAHGMCQRLTLFYTYIARTGIVIGRQTTRVYHEHVMMVIWVWQIIK